MFDGAKAGNRPATEPDANLISFPASAIAVAVIRICRHWSAAYYFNSLPMRHSHFIALTGLLVVILVGAERQAQSSTYVVYIPLDSPIYEELETLTGLGCLDTYLSEIKPISRIEAARLTLEAEENLDHPEDIASSAESLANILVGQLRKQLADEIGWLENNTEDSQPTTIHPLDRVEAQYVYSYGPRR